MKNIFKLPISRLNSIIIENTDITNDGVKIFSKLVRPFSELGVGYQQNFNYLSYMKTYSQFCVKENHFSIKHPLYFDDNGDIAFISYLSKLILGPYPWKKMKMEIFDLEGEY